jgi:spore coat polysaccharide biosynthesis protein SpsF
VISSVDLSHHRWTVDTPEDYVLVHRLFEHLVHSQPNFTQHDVLALLNSHPEWIAINQHIRQKLATETQIPKENA